MESSHWSWLEVLKLGISAFTPVVLLFLGIWAQRAVKRFEHQQWRSQKLIEKRIRVYEELAPELNCLLCYYIRVGNWRGLSPKAIINKKREIDKQIYLAKPLFSGQFFDICMKFMDLCFETYTGAGKDAKLRTTFEGRKRVFEGTWDPEWDYCFSKSPTAEIAIHEGYESVMDVFSSELGVCDLILSDDSPSNAQPERNSLRSIVMECAS